MATVTTKVGTQLAHDAALLSAKLAKSAVPKVHPDARAARARHSRTR